MNTPSQQLAAITTAELSEPIKAEPSVGQMLSAFIERGITQDNVQAFERLIALRERLEDRDAERQFAEAFTAMQAEMPEVQAVKAVPNKDGTIRYRYAPYEEIMKQVRPLLQKHGFTVTFSSAIAEGRVTQSCTLQHRAGHKRQNQFMARIGNGPPGSSDAQADGAAATYAQRQVFCDALNIIVSLDTDGVPPDARTEGTPITFEEAQTLREMCKESNSAEDNFLMYAGAPTFEKIGSARYAMLFAALQRKINKR